MKRTRILPLAVALTFPLWGCPPTLTGEACDSDCACPSGQSCLFEAAGDTAGTCQDGTNTCANPDDGGALPDAGDAGDAGSHPDAGDAGDAGGSAEAFQGVVVLNGGAVPPNTAKVYGFADGTPVANQNGVYTAADVTQLTNNQGVVVFPNPVPAATDDGYRFVAVYDTKGRGDYSIDDPGIYDQFSVGSIAPGSSQALSLRIDIQTSTCFSITDDFGQAATGTGVTYFIGVGTIADDIRTGAPLVSQTDLDTVAATFDAGSALPPGGGLPGSGVVNLEPVANVPGFDITDSWFYPSEKSQGWLLSNSGTFYVTLTDGTKAQPEYPSGTCEVTYQPPPGFPGNLAINGMDGGTSPDSGVLWLGAIASGGPNGKERVSWEDYAGTLPAGDTFVGNIVVIAGTLPDGGTLQLFPDAGPGQITFVGSPIDIAPGIVPPNLCDQGTKSYCAFEVTSFYQDAHKARAIAFEGGSTLLPFQRATLTPPPGN